MKPTQIHTPALIARFWPKVARGADDQCWEWRGARNRSGYGIFRVGGGGTSPVNAYRVAYEIVVGVIPEGLFLDHLCRNRACVNPGHLEPVTPKVNTLRGAGPTAKNALRTHCKRGHEFTPENTIAHPLGRNCRECRRLADRARRDRKKIEGVPTSPCQNP